MRTIRFGRTNVTVPTISLGTWGHGGPNTSEGASVGWSGHDDRLAKEALVEAHRRGIRHWDTADAYGNGHAETLIGEVFASGVPREDIFLATKFGWVKGPHDHFYDAGFMRAQCERSLRNLRTEVIDLYYFHHCDFGPNDVYFDAALATMRRLREEGKIRFIGLSDWSARKIMRFIDRVDPDAVQPFRLIVSMNKSTAAGSIVAVISTSALRRGLPQTIAACAPKTYQGRSRSAITAAKARRSSATVRRLDTTEHLRNADVGGEILPPILFRGPVVSNRADVMSQFVAHLQRLSGLHSRFLLSPVASLERRDGAPIATSESDYILLAHEPRIALLIAGTRARIRERLHGRLKTHVTASRKPSSVVVPVLRVGSDRRR